MNLLFLVFVFVFGEESISIDFTYDLREKFPECVNLFKPIFQGSCNSSWAITVSSVIADHLCCL
jgi:hypothetical protein